MAAAGRRGRRDNGLDASDWRAIEDLDPRLTEEVLTVFAARGIAAYVQPAVDVDPVTRSATVPARPSDRLYVDRARVSSARALLRELLGREDPGEDPGAVDAAFAGIVAGFDDRVDPTAAPWPVVEDLKDGPEPAPPDPLDEPLPEPPATSLSAEPTLLDALDTFGTDPPERQPGERQPEELPDRFVPPAPPPLPRLSRQAIWGGLAILGGLLLVLTPPSVLPLERSTTMLLGFGAILGGAVALILRLRPEPDPDDPTGGRPPDDGAQV